jgi:hypothetical protein
MGKRLTVALWLLALLLLMVAIGLGVAGDYRPLQGSKTLPLATKAQLSLERIAARDPRIEVLARAICSARGINPDYRGFPYPPGPVWETYILQARDFLAAYDAARHTSP